MSTGDVRVTVRGALTGENVFNVLHFRALTPGGIPTLLGQADLQALADEVYDAWVDHIMPLRNSAFQLQETQAENVDDGTTPFPGTHTANTNGGIAGAEMLPSYVALAWRLRTNLGSRRGRGRVFMAGFDESSSGGNGLTPAALALEQAASVSVLGRWDPFLLPSANTAAWAVYSRVDNVTRPIVQIQVETRFDTMRSRKVPNL